MTAVLKQTGAGGVEHVQRIDLNGAWKLLEKINPHLSAALKELQARLTKTIKGESPSLYLASYEYGDSIVNVPDELQSILVPPCQTGSLCDACRQLTHDCRGRLPIGVVVEKTAEVFLEYGPSSTYPPFVPLRILRPGEAFGAFELLDDIMLPSRHSKPQWRVQAGARSIFISVPLGNEKLGRRVTELMRAPDKKLARKFKEMIPRFDKDSWYFIRAILAAARTDNDFKSTSPLSYPVKLLIFPEAWLKSFAYGSNAQSTASFFLHSVKDIGWKQSFHLRQYRSDEAQIASAFASLSGDFSGLAELKKIADRAYLYRSLLHIFAIARGDLPGFIPVRSEIEEGPFTAALEYMNQIGLLEAPGLRGYFPLMLQPWQLDQPEKSTGNSIAYYSMERPTMLGPTVEPANQGEMMAALYCALQVLRRAGIGKGLTDWQLYTTKSDWTDEGIERVAESQELKADFKEQLQMASEWQVETDQLWKAVRGQFLTRCVRIHSASASFTAAAGA